MNWPTRRLKNVANELNQDALEAAREATYFGGLEAAIVAYLEALPGAGAENAAPSKHMQETECRPNSGFDSRDRGQALPPDGDLIERAAGIICKELFGFHEPYDEKQSPLTPYGQSIKAAQALASSGLILSRDEVLEEAARVAEAEEVTEIPFGEDQGFVSVIVGTNNATKKSIAAKIRALKFKSNTGE